jgi:hypothetical protein
MFEHIKVGDVVIRMLAGVIPMKLTVTHLDHTFIYCGDWKFRRRNGAEVDEELGWDTHGTGSYLIPTERKQDQ